MGNLAHHEEHFICHESSTFPMKKIMQVKLMVFYTNLVQIHF